MIALAFQLSSLILESSPTTVGDMEAEYRATGIAGALIVLGLILLVVGWLRYRRVIVNRRKRKVRKFIEAFSKTDPFWNEQQMAEISREIFTYVQVAWVKRNFYYVTNYVTDELKKEWETTWKKMATMNYGFHCGKIDLDRVILIGVEDYSNDEKDSFSVEISGYLKRYMFNKRTMRVIYKNTSELEYITDVYTFVRRSDQWQLNKINYNADLSDVLDKKIAFEKPGKPEDT